MKWVVTDPKRSLFQNQHFKKACREWNLAFSNAEQDQVPVPKKDILKKKKIPSQKTTTL